MPSARLAGSLAIALCGATLLSPGILAHRGSVGGREEIAISTAVTTGRVEAARGDDLRIESGDVTVRGLPPGVHPPTLVPGSYGALHVDAGAEVMISSGAYRFETLRLGAGATLWLGPGDGAGDPLVITVERALRLDEGAEITLFDASEASIRKIEIRLLQKGTIEIPAYAVVQGTVVASRARLVLRAGSRLEGIALAAGIEVAPDATIEPGLGTRAIPAR